MISPKKKKNSRRHRQSDLLIFKRSKENEKNFVENCDFPLEFWKFESSRILIKGKCGQKN